jgi:hypothetical protein
MADSMDRDPTDHRAPPPARPEAMPGETPRPGPGTLPAPVGEQTSPVGSTAPRCWSASARRGAAPSWGRSPSATSRPCRAAGSNSRCAARRPTSIAPAKRSPSGQTPTSRASAHSPRSTPGSVTAAPPPATSRPRRADAPDPAQIHRGGAVLSPTRRSLAQQCHRGVFRRGEAERDGA